MNFKNLPGTRVRFKTDTTKEGLVKEKPVEDKSDVDIRIRLVTNEKLFARLADSWNELADQAGMAVYSRFEWIYCWWKHFGRHPKRELFIVTVYSNQKLIGIAPLYIGRSSIGPFTIQRRLYLMGCGTDQNEFFGFINDYGYSDFLDVIAHPLYRITVAEIFAKILKDNPMKADIVCFQHVNDRSFIKQKLLPCLDAKNIHYYMEKSDECPYLTLPGTLEEYIEQTGPSSRRRRLRKNLQAAGTEYLLETATTIEEVEKGVELLVSLHQKRWNSLGFPGAFFDRRHLHFVREISKILHQKGWIWFKFAIDQEGYSAARLAINDGDTCYDWLSGFDDAAPSSNLSPGLGLLAILIMEAIESKASIVELERGGERYKFDFTSELRYNWQISLPYYVEKSGLYSVLNKLLTIVSKLYYRITREWLLIRIHYRQAGLLKMGFSYLSFRYGRVVEKKKK